MSEPITYAKAGVTPADWDTLDVLDLDTGAKLDKIVEVNATEGWIVRIVTDEDGEFVLNETRDGAAHERVEGRFEIRRPA